MQINSKNILTKATNLFFALFFITLHSLNAQVDIKIKLPEVNQENYYLARYYGDKFQMVDTALIKSDSIVQFVQPEIYPEGIYLLVDQSKTRLLEFLIADDQTFTLEIPNNHNKQLSCSGSINTCLFMEQMNYTNLIYSQIKLLEDNQDDLAKKDSLLNLLATYQDSIKTNYSDSFVAKILSAMEEIKIPDSIATDQRKAYYYYKSNYWNKFDLSDDRFLRSPLLNTKIKQYFEQLVPQQADSIIKEVDFLIGQTKDNNTMRDYLIWYFTDQYQNPKIMGLDKVFVHLADSYFAHLEIANASPSVKQKIMERADQLRRLTLGSPAPDLWLVDTTDVFVSFKSIELPYVVLFFWDHDCGVCKKELKTLQELYVAQNRNFEIYGIAVNADFNAWEAYLRKNDLPWINVNGMKSMTPDFHDLYDIYGTPVIYVLDPERKIIAKRIKADQIPMVIEYDQKFRATNAQR